MKPRPLRLAAVQTASANGRVAENLARASHLAERYGFDLPTTQTGDFADDS